MKRREGPGWSLSSDEEPAPAFSAPSGPPRARIRVEKRRGKAVTVIAGLHTWGGSRLNGLASELRRRFGTGGTVKQGTIELQGDWREAVENFLRSRDR